MARLRDLLTDKELEIYKRGASFVTPNFGSVEDEKRYYDQLWTDKPSSKVVFNNADPSAGKVNLPKRKQP
jgi:hypothetical protein